MELFEYKEKIKLLESDFKISKENLAIKYANANNPYKIGDIIKDSTDCIKIDKIIPCLHYDKPYCMYRGVLLKKDLTPKKNGDRGAIYQHQIIP